MEKEAVLRILNSVITMVAKVLEEVFGAGLRAQFCVDEETTREFERMGYCHCFDRHDLWDRFAFLPGYETDPEMKSMVGLFIFLASHGKMGDPTEGPRIMERLLLVVEKLGITVEDLNGKFPWHKFETLEDFVHPLKNESLHCVLIDLHDVLLWKEFGCHKEMQPGHWLSNSVWRCTHLWDDFLGYSNLSRWYLLPSEDLSGSIRKLAEDLVIFNCLRGAKLPSGENEM